MRTYHATPIGNIETIKKEGLLPQVGAYASTMGETEKAIWLFRGLEEAEEMVPLWLEPFYESELVLLEVTLPDDFPLWETGSDYEVLTLEKIPPEYISII